MDRYRITYFNVKTGQREVYLNNTSFTEKKAQEELERLIVQEIRKSALHRYRYNWKKEKIKFKK